MKSKHIILLILATISMSAAAQRTGRGPLKLQRPITHQISVIDTIRIADGDITASGYEKTQSSAYESVFVTNNTSHHIKSVNLSVRYENESGQQLHERTETVKVYIPAGETRQISFKTWDRQHLWYYIDSQASHNDNGSAFTVKIRFNYITADKPKTLP